MAKKEKPIIPLYFVTSVLFFAAAIIGYATKNSMATVWLCLGSLWLCLGAVGLKKAKTTTEENGNENQTEDKN